MKEKPRILYIERNTSPVKGTPVSERITEHKNIVVETLREDYDVQTQFSGLTSNSINTIEEALKKGQRFEGLVTHIKMDYSFLQDPSPNREIRGISRYERLSGIYGDSINILNDISEKDPELYIVAYTGALVGDSDKDEKTTNFFEQETEIDDFVPKYGDVSKSARLLKEYLDRNLK